MTEHNNQPLTQFREGDVNAAVWANKEHRDGIVKTTYSIRIRKQFRKRDGSWQTTDYYFPKELKDLRSVVDQATAFVAEKESEDGEETAPVPE